MPDVDEIRTFLFSADTAAEAYLCEIEGDIAGYAVISLGYSTWPGRYSLNVEDL
jgi:hypothetical protein